MKNEQGWIFANLDIKLSLTQPFLEQSIIKSENDNNSKQTDKQTNQANWLVDKWFFIDQTACTQ